MLQQLFILLLGLLSQFTPLELEDNTLFYSSESVVKAITAETKKGVTYFDGLAKEREKTTAQKRACARDLVGVRIEGVKGLKIVGAWKKLSDAGVPNLGNKIDEIENVAKYIDNKQNINIADEIAEVGSYRTWYDTKVLNNVDDALEAIVSPLRGGGKYTDDVLDELKKAFPDEASLKKVVDEDGFKIWINHTDEGRKALAQNKELWFKQLETRSLLKNGDHDGVIELYNGTKLPSYEHNGARYIIDGNPDIKALDDIEAIIRNSNDVSAISAKFDLPIHMVKEVKEHYFVKEFLIKGPEGFKIGRFEKTAQDIAIWKGAENGFENGYSFMFEGSNIITRKADAIEEFKRLFAHEYIESQLMKKGMSYKALDELNGLHPYDYGAHDIAPRLRGGYSEFLELKHTIPEPNNSLDNLDDIIRIYIDNLNL